MRIDLWRRIRTTAWDAPAAIVLVTKRRRVVLEFGRTRFLPLFCKQLFRTPILSAWYDPIGGH